MQKSQSPLTRILIADDHELFRRGISELLGRVIPRAKLTEASTGEEVVKLVTTFKDWDLVLLDFSMPDSDGIDLIKDIRRAAPNILILVLSGHPEEQFAMQVLRAGAAGFVNKGSPSSEIAGAVKKILA